MYSCSNDNLLVGCIDSDFAGSIDDRKSTSSYAFHLILGLISWASKKYPIVTICLAKIEYIATTSIACHIDWIKIILTYPQ